MKAPLFSSYRQGENRVTSSILAVLERIDMARVEQLLAAASGESALEMVQFRNQPAGRHAVPDASVDRFDPVTRAQRYPNEFTPVNQRRP